MVAQYFSLRSPVACVFLDCMRKLEKTQRKLLQSEEHANSSQNGKQSQFKPETFLPWATDADHQTTVQFLVLPYVWF